MALLVDWKFHLRVKGNYSFELIHHFHSTSVNTTIWHAHSNVHCFSTSSKLLSWYLWMIIVGQIGRQMVFRSWNECLFVTGGVFLFPPPGNLHNTRKYLIEGIGASVALFMKAHFNIYMISMVLFTYRMQTDTFLPFEICNRIRRFRTPD